MLASFPHIGLGWISFKALLETLGCKVLVPPPVTKRTIELGVRYSPEFVCFPFKVNIGNFIEALQLGADTLFMVGGSGTCRLGFYNVVQQCILRNLNYQFKMIPLNQDTVLKTLFGTLRKVNPKNTYLDVIYAFSVFWHKAKRIAEIEQLSRKIKPYETIPGQTDKVKDYTITLVEKADTLKKIKSLKHTIAKLFGEIPTDPSRKPIKIGIVGEVYVSLESYVNLNIENRLEKLNVEVHKPMSIYKWLRVLFKIDFERLYNKHIAKPYLSMHTAGEDQQSIGHTIRWAKAGYDGIIMLYPFTCMPEVLAKGILSSNVINRFKIPMLFISLDEQTQEGALQTRLEAFVDLLRRRRFQRDGSLPRY